jgi:hypothetical protein
VVESPAGKRQFNSALIQASHTGINANKRTESKKFLVPRLNNLHTQLEQSQIVGF